MFDQWSNNIDKSNIKYHDVIIKWLNITTLRANIYKRHALHYNVVIKCLNVTISILNIDKRCTLYYNLIHREVNAVLAMVLPYNLGTFTTNYHYCHYYYP